MHRRVHQIESFLFFAYIVLAISFYGFKGYTFVPQLVGALLGAFYIFKILLTKEKFYFSLSQKLLLSFFAYLSVSIILFFPYDFQFILSFMQFFMLFHISLNIIARKEAFRIVLWAFLTGIVILIYNRVTASNTLLDVLSERLGSTAGNQNDYGFILGSTTLLLLFNLVRSKASGRLQLITWLVIIVIQIENFIYAGSRTAIAMSLVAILSYTIYKLWQARPIQKLVIVGIGVILIVNLATILPSLETFRRIVQLTEAVNKPSNSVMTSSGLRLGFMEDGVRLWKESPVWGHGSNRFRYINRIKEDFYSHNNFIEILSNNGIIGIVLFYTIHLFILYQVNRRWSGPKPSFLWWFNVILLCLLIVDMGRVSYYNKIYLLMLSFLCGSLIYYRRKSLLMRSQILIRQYE